MKKTYKKLATLLKEDCNYSLDELRKITKSKTNYSLFNKLFLIIITRIREIDFKESIDKYEDILRSLDYVSEILASNSFIMLEKLKEDINLFKDVIYLKRSEIGIDKELHAFLSTLETIFYEGASAYINRMSETKIEDKTIINSSEISPQRSEKTLLSVKSNLFNVFEGTSYINTKIIQMDDYINRFDLTDDYIITIDCDSSCKILDDAVSINYLEDGTYMLGVYIADISNYLLQRKVLGGDTFVDSVNFFLNNKSYIPIGISKKTEYEHSLFPRALRTTIAHFIKLDNQGEVIDFGMYKTIIKSKKRINYDDAYKILNSPKEANSILKEKIYYLSQMALILESKHKNRIIPNNEEQYEQIYKNSTISRKIIERAILITGSSVADYFKKQSLPIIYKKPSSYTSEPTLHSELGVDAYCNMSRPLKRACDRFNQMIINDFCFSSKIPDKMVYTWEDNVKKLVLRLNGDSEKSIRINMLNVVE